MITTFTNPRLQASFPDWPLGGSKRGLCTFRVEKHPSRGSRVLRQTTGKPKASSYSTLCAIVDADDGRTYLLHYNSTYGAISIYQSDNAHCAHFGQSGDHYHHLSHSPHFATLYAMILQANA